MISHIEYVKIRDVWKNETTDFNTWLFEEDNLKYLGVELGMDLIPHKRELKINKGRIDVLAINRFDDSYVLIENQIAKADHQHYGKIIEYINNIKPKYTIWIAHEWTDFHKNTIKIIEDLTKLFVVKIDVIRIGNSKIGVKFTTIIEPQNWKRNRKYFGDDLKIEKQKNVSESAKEMENFVQFNFWIEDIIASNEIKQGQWISKKNILEKWTIYLQSLNINSSTPHMFSKLFKYYSITTKIGLEIKKTNGVEYYKIKSNEELNNG